MDEVHIIAIVSGKGGVGKTMLAGAIANELARRNKTLLMDLDFFNRGLTGLLASLSAGSPKISITPPPIFSETQFDNKWEIAAVQKNLYFVSHDDLDKSQTESFERMEISDLMRMLRKYICSIAETSECEVVVLDCHGGPDNISFAACLAAEHAILASEPDRITLHGTLHFLRVLAMENTERKPDIRLVFNKVIPAFSSTFLSRFYVQYLKTEFGGRDLLGVYPLEAYLTKAFERTPFLTTVYPISQLAIKTRLLLYDLFIAEARQILSPSILSMSWLYRTYHRYSMGRQPKVLDLDFIFKAIALVGIFFFALPGVISSAIGDNTASTGIDNYVQISVEYGYGAILVCFCWLLAALLLNWSRQLDMVLTYGFRTGAFGKAALACLAFTAIWYTAIAVVVALGFDEIGALSDKSGNPITASSFWVPAARTFFVILLSWPLGRFAMRGLRNIRFDGWYVEGWFRIAFSLVAVACAALIAAFV